MTRKPFDKDLYNENDKKAKDIIIKHLSKNYIVGHNPDMFGPDLFALDGTETFYVEVEIKHNWDGPIFPFNTVNIPKRKEKYLETGEVLYCILSKDLSQCINVEGKHLKREYLKEVRNKYVPEGEMFFQIPLRFCRMVSL